MSRVETHKYAIHPPLGERAHRSALGDTGAPRGELTKPSRHLVHDNLLKRARVAAHARAQGKREVTWCARASAKTGAATRLEAGAGWNARESDRERSRDRGKGVIARGNRSIK